MPSDQQTRTAEAAETSNWGQSCAARCPTCRQLLHSEDEVRPHPTTTKRSSTAEMKLTAGGQTRPRHVPLVASPATVTEVCSQQARGDVDDASNATAALDAAIALTSLDHKIQGDAISEFIRAGRKRPFSSYNVFVSWFYKNLDIALQRESVADLSPFETLRLLLGQPGSTTPDKVLQHSRRRCHKERCAPPSAPPPSCASTRELGRLWKELEQNFPELKQQCDKVASADQKIYKTVKKSRQQL